MLTKACIVKTMVFPVVEIWVLDHKVSWVPRIYVFNCGAGKDSCKSLDSKIKPVNPKANQHCELSSISILYPWISQAIILEWLATSFSRASSWPRDQTCVFCVSCIVFFTSECSRIPFSPHPLQHFLWKRCWETSVAQCQENINNQIKNGQKT